MQLSNVFDHVAFVAERSVTNVARKRLDVQMYDVDMFAKVPLFAEGLAALWTVVGLEFQMDVPSMHIERPLF
jgi:hypothetical protein